MQFADTTITVQTRNAGVPVRITGDALHTLWGEGIGPQDAAGLIAANNELIEEIAGDKLLAGQLDNGVVIITGLDIEG
jgi:hypothetical protein